MKGNGWKLGAKWFTCDQCGKQSLVRKGARRKHYRGCKKADWHRNAQSPVVEPFNIRDDGPDHFR